VKRAASASSIFVLTAGDALEARLTPNDSKRDAAPEHFDAQHNQGVAPRNLAALARLPHHLSTTGQILGQIDFSGSSRRELRVRETFVAPHNGLEMSIAAEWSAILRLDKIGRNDNFFELGGNSLLLVRLNGNLISTLGREISITEMFRYPTVASLAGYLAGQSPGRTPETNSRGTKARSALLDRKRQLAAQHFQNRVSQVYGP